MGIKTKIEYADSTINPVIGCTGCELYSDDPKKNHCYAAAMTRRWAGCKGWPEHFNSPIHVPGRLEKAIKWPDLTGTERPDKPWLDGLPRVIFVNDLSDGFCPDVDPGGWLHPYLDAMEASPHIYLLLTKWPQRMGEYFRSLGGVPDNFALGTSVLRPRHNYRIRALLDIRGGFKWLSLEPLLEEVRIPPHQFTAHNEGGWQPGGGYKIPSRRIGIDWVIVGGESGPGARPMNPGWARSLRDQCQAADVPFFFKSWGAWAPDIFGLAGYRKVGKKDAASRLLDGRQWNEMPPAARQEPGPEFYCEEHRYNPPPNSGLCFCPRCEFPDADYTVPSSPEWQERRPF